MSPPSSRFASSSAKRDSSYGQLPTALLRSRRYPRDPRTCSLSTGTCRALRRSRAPQTVRLIILSALSGEEHVVTGLNLGADDYITKPFSLREVVARVGVLLRSHSHETEHLALCCDDLVLDAATNRVTIRGKLVNLRGVEYRLLEFLMAHNGRTFNRTQLLSQVWGGDTEVDERTVDVNVQRLRKILKIGRASCRERV